MCDKNDISLSSLNLVPKNAATFLFPSLGIIRLRYCTPQQEYGQFGFCANIHVRKWGHENEVLRNAHFLRCIICILY
jgi:hypothetical protein